MTRLLRLCPDFVVELLSPSDRLKTAKLKMESWIENGVSVGWLIDPYKKRVFVYRPGVDPSTVFGGSIAGSGPVDGFSLDLHELWLCYQL